jgi:hypothetical protein
VEDGAGECGLERRRHVREFYQRGCWLGSRNLECLNPKPLLESASWRDARSEGQLAQFS